MIRASITRVHRLGAILLGLFIIGHLAVHLTAWWGPEMHASALKSMQILYRHPFAEGLLVLVVLSQVVTGAARLRRRRPAGWARVQKASGIMLLIFLLFHTSAALYTHHVFGLETDFYWAAGSLHYDPIRYGFALYYAAAIMAAFLHVTAALCMRYRTMPKWFAVALPAGGAIVTMGILLPFAGMLYPVEIGDDVARYYHANFGFLIDAQP